MDSMGASAQYWAAFFLGLGAVGCFGALFVWAWLGGQFKNIENPKNRILQLDQKTGVKK